ncbi:hypothetical protein RHGRI_023749 [Rhododendron griersonianum]|uniref:Uncharacterized protein n=1 Tax=Rhododendron griersonianum TaxID=479676 RepID=A0AAV6J8P7_9ERIC|nr:hypothetical protein RHGRI_023749 [Rhododendron griersonianum]
MASSVLLMCKYGELTLVVMVTRDVEFDDLVQNICKKYWENLVSCRFELSYIVVDHHNCVLGMIALVAACGENFVDVSVGVISSSFVECGKVWLDKMVNVVDVLNMVCVVVVVEKKKIHLKSFVLVVRRCVFQRIGLI